VTARKDQFNVTASIDGIGNMGTFDSMTGGEVDSDEQKYRPGGMAAPVSLGGAVTMGNVVIARLALLDRDYPILHKLLSLAGIANITVTKQPLDDNKTPYGRPLVYTGKVKTVTPPEHDSTSSDPALLTIEFVPTGSIG
jgi:hypothetical protein